MNLTAQSVVSLSSLQANILAYKYNPAQIQSQVLSYLQSVMDGQVDIVDPTNPFVFLLEASAVSTAGAISEGENLVRKLYPALAYTEDELYLHMSDLDFVGRFSSPATANFYFMIEKDSLLQNMVLDPTTGLNTAIISRYTSITINGLIFTMQYPIILQQYPSGNIQISYDTSEPSMLQTVPNSLITYTETTDQQGTTWLLFSVPVLQVAIDSNTYPVVSASYFTQKIPFTDQFYYCRVFNKAPDSTGAWTELQTTFTQQVFDPATPTAILKIVDNSTIEVSIPQIYVENNLIDGDVRVDVYTTKGSVDVNMQNYLISSFQTVLQDLDGIAATSPYRAAMSNVIYLTYCDQTVSGGSDGVSFDTLREQVINNAIGNPQEPITGPQLASYEAKQGFTLTPNVDVITDRVYLASRDLPAPSGQQFLTPVSIAVETLNTTMHELAAISTCNVSGNRATLLPQTLYNNVNGVLQVYPNSQYEIMQNMDAIELQDLINANDFLFTPFYYVLDNSGTEFDVRSYNLSMPSASGLGYSSYNSSLDFQVNTGSYTLTQTSSGYQLTVSTKSDANYKKLPDGAVGIQMSYLDPVTGTRCYLDGFFTGTNSAGERIFTFDIPTQYDVDSNDYLYITANDSSMTKTTVATLLSQIVDIIYLITDIPAGFVAPSFQNLVGSLLMVNEVNGNYSIGATTHEQLTLTYGQSLTYLWNSFRSVLSGQEYATYAEDVPEYYLQNVYKTDSQTGSIFSFDSNGNIVWNLIHSAGDPVLDNNGNQVYSHRAGDVMLDSAGNPILINSNKTNRLIDLVLFEGVFYFSNNSAVESYMQGVTQLITGWATTVLESIQQVLISNTSLYLFPHKTKGRIKVLADGNISTYIEAAQDLVVSLYLPPVVYNNPKLIKRLQETAISIINTFLSNPLVAVSQIIKSLTTTYGSDVVGVSLSGLGGAANNYQTIVISNSENKLSLGKRIVKASDNTFTVEENVVFNIYEVGN